MFDKKYKFKYIAECLLRNVLIIIDIATEIHRNTQIIQKLFKYKI